MTRDETYQGTLLRESTSDLVISMMLGVPLALAIGLTAVAIDSSRKLISRGIATIYNPTIGALKDQRYIPAHTERVEGESMECDGLPYLVSGRIVKRNARI